MQAGLALLSTVAGKHAIKGTPAAQQVVLYRKHGMH